MEKSKLALLVTGILMVAIIALGYFIGVKPQLDKRDQAETELQSVEAQNARYQAVIDAMKAEEGNRDAYEITLAELRKSLPKNLDYSRFLGELQTYSQGAHVVITNITTGTPQSYVPPAGEASSSSSNDSNDDADDEDAAEQLADEAAGDDSDDAGDAAESAGSDDDVSTGSSQIDSDNLVQVPVQVQFVGLKSDSLKFVDWLQTGPRLYLIDSMSTTPGEFPDMGDDENQPEPPATDEDDDAEDDPVLETTVDGFIYVLVSDVE